MNIDELLSKAAEDVAARADLTPPPDVAEVRRRARDVRRRQVAGAGVATAAVVAGVMLGTAGPGDDSAPEPVDAPPGRAQLEGAVWVDDDGLHVGDRAGDPPDATEWRGTWTVSGLTLVEGGVVYGLLPVGAPVGPCETFDVYFRETSGQTHLLSQDALTPPVGDPLGSHVAWFERDRDLVVVDTSTGEETARAEDALHLLDSFCDNRTLSVNDSSVTYLSSGLAYTFDWTRDSQPVRSDLDRGALVDRMDDLDAVAVETRPSDGAGENLVRIRFDSPRGATGVSGWVSSWGSFSPDSRYFVTADDNERLVVLDTQTAEPIPMSLAADYFVADRGWGIGDTMLVGFRTEREDPFGPGPAPWRLAVCDVSEGECAFVSDGEQLPAPHYPVIPH
jgi:hypothetical protein